MTPRRRFLIWTTILSLLWVLANWPHQLGLKRLLERAGFPWTFAFWEYGSLTLFDRTALALDIGLGLLFALGLAGLCCWSQRPAGDDPACRHLLPLPEDTGRVSPAS